MSIIRQLRTLFTKTNIYPYTVTEAVLDKDGNPLNAALDNINNALTAEEQDDIDIPVEMLPAKMFATREEVEELENGIYENLNDVRNTRLVEGYFADSVTNNNRNSPYITPRAGYFRNAYNTACTMAFVLPSGTSQNSDYVMLNVPSGQTMSIYVPKGVKLYCQVGSGIFLG